MEMVNERTLMERFQAGDQAAFREIFDQINGTLVGWLIKTYAATEVQAEDIAAETWVKIYQNRQKLNSVEFVRRFAFLVAKNQGIDIWRQKRKVNEFSQKLGYLVSEEDGNIEEEDNFEERIALLKEAMKALGNKTAMALKLYFFDNKDTPEVAEILGVARQTALNLKTNAIDALKEMMVLGRMPKKRAVLKKAKPAPQLANVAASAINEGVYLPAMPGPALIRRAVTRYVYEQHLAELMVDFKAGKEDAFRYIFDLYNSEFWNFIRYLDTHEAREDMLSDLWYSIFKHRTTFNSLEHIKLWGFVALRNNQRYWYIRVAARKKAMQQMEYRSSDCSWESDSNREHLVTSIREILRRMNRAGAKVLEMQFFEDMDIAEIAEKMGVGIKAVYKNRSYALELLKESLEPLRHTFA